MGIRLDSFANDSSKKPRRKGLATAVAVAIAIIVLTVGAVGFASIASNPKGLGQPSQTSATSSVVTSTSSSQTSTSSYSVTSIISSQYSGLCVRVGEPFYPYPQTIPLQSFVQNMQMSYQVTVNLTARLVIVTNPNGGGVGSVSSSSVSVPIVSC